MSSLETFASPRPDLEQYTTPGDIAAEVLAAASDFGDIAGKTVCDLGCGAGVFSIGAAVLGAKSVTGVDIDGAALEIAKRNKARFPDLPITFVESDVGSFSGRFDTVIQNPPFGAQKKGSDRPFLEKACDVAGVVYTLHQANTRSFINEFVTSLNREPTLLKTFKFPLTRCFRFHKKKVVEVEVDLFRVV